ncbi:putative potassium channel, voltage-dependent, ERG [Rosa chinensis]|uniref:Putative potassium channel, voltage-dependent, ERG n=1 Tax=Rosa chinensis TaxID=74649 RepID=A0A2P6QR99_ROSCH|nr:cyclic nucleotide-gated ion channel 1 [Rosa chinensis]PRQ36714.1 putative potassium channel, voltage-dependent, ERG [Rosa chinensis]
MSAHPGRAVEDANVPAGKVNETEKKWETMLPSVSFWNNISGLACMIAVSMDPLFFYIAFLDKINLCLGMEEGLRSAVLITRSLTDFTFLFHIVYQICEAVKAVPSVSRPKPVQRGNSKLFKWFGYAKAIAKKLSWSSFLTDIFAIIPIPHVLILALFYAPNHGFSQNKMTLNYMLLAQYVPRMYRIFISSRLFRKNSSVWLKAAFYFFMYILSSHIIGGFWYFSCVQMEALCWYQALRGRTSFKCGDPPLSAYKHEIIRTMCSGTKEIFDFGSFLDTIKDGFTGPIKFRKKLFYFIWWGLKNLSNYGTNINTSEYMWENCFAILVSSIGLVLFALLIGNMQQCMRSSEEKEAAIDKVQMKEQELHDWMKKYDLHKKLGKDAEKLRIEIMTKITKNLKDDKNAQVQNLFSLLPWNTIEDLKLAVCMDMLQKVRSLENMDETGLKQICHHLKPVTYTKTTLPFQMGKRLDRMLFIMEGIMLTYPISTTTTTADHQVGRVNPPLKIRGLLEKGDVYGEQLLSWASPRDLSSVSDADLPILTENVECLLEVEGFVLSAQDLKNVVSGSKLHGNSSSLLVEGERHSPKGTSRRLHHRIKSIPRPGIEGGDEKTDIQDSNN